jgi:hypothetical protein
MSHVYRRPPLLMRDNVVSSIDVPMVSIESHKEDADFEKKNQDERKFWRRLCDVRRTWWMHRYLVLMRSEASQTQTKRKEAVRGTRAFALAPVTSTGRGCRVVPCLSCAT